MYEYRSKSVNSRDAYFSSEESIPLKDIFLYAKDQKAYYKRRYSIASQSIETSTYLSPLEQLDISELERPNETTGFAAAHVAAGNALTLKELIERKASMNQLTKSGKTPLHLAIVGNHILCCILLISNDNCDLNYIDEQGNTYLHYCSFLQETTILTSLLSKIGKTHLKIKNLNGHTPISLAVFEGNADMVTKILEYDVSYKEYVNQFTGDTLLHLAYEKYEIAKELIKMGFSIEEKNLVGMSFINLVTSIQDLATKVKMCGLIPENKLLSYSSTHFEKVVVHLDMKSCQLKIGYIDYFLKMMNLLNVRCIEY